jgi:hypothetical protein
LPTEKLTICGLDIRGGNRVTEMQRIASVTEGASIEINVTEKHLKSGTFEINPGQDII